MVQLVPFARGYLECSYQNSLSHGKDTLSKLVQKYALDTPQ